MSTEEPHLSQEQALEKGIKNLKHSERKRTLFNLGLSETELIKEELNTQALVLSETAETLIGLIGHIKTLGEQGEERLGDRVDAIKRAEELIDSFDKFTDALQTLTIETSNVLSDGIVTIKNLLTNMNSKLDEEVEKSITQRELELETMTNINKYLRKYI